jgi:hypothetical protein
MSAPQFTIGAVYRLDGELFRLTKFKGLDSHATFQRIKPDGTDDIGKHPNNDNGTKGVRLIRYRLSEMEQVNEQWQCNECGVQSYTQSVTIEDLQCPECGCDEFHLTPEKP